MTENNNTVAILGLGLIGSIWARHLHDAGMLAASWNRTPQTDAPKPVSSALEAAEKTDVIIIVVSNPSAVRSVIESILPVLNSRHLIIQSSTIGPQDTGLFRGMVTATGAHYLEAPFTGSKPAAEAKKTIFYLGGSEEDTALAEPVLQSFSALRIHCGTGEQACTIKLAMNLQISAQFEALCEALALSRTAGVSDDTFFTVMKNNAAWSGVAALKEPKLRTGDYTPQFSVKLMLKDLKLLEQNPQSLPALRRMIERLEQAERDGLGDKDFSVLYEFISKEKN